jgi:hypothetical protein
VASAIAAAKPSAPESGNHPSRFGITMGPVAGGPNSREVFAFEPRVVPAKQVP